MTELKRFGDGLISTSGVELPLTSAIEINGIVYLSGTLGLRDGKIAGDDIDTQANQLFDNVEALLAQEGLGLGNVIKVLGWLARREDFAGYNAVFAKRLPKPFPTRTTLLSGLLCPGALIEAEITAYRPPA